MNRNLKRIVIITFVIVFFYNAVLAANWESLVPEGGCSWYALKEFEKIAPPPGANWIKENKYYVKQATSAGWVIKLDPHDAIIGALVEWYNPLKGGHLAIVRFILSDSIIVEEMNFGKPTGLQRAKLPNGEVCTMFVSENWGKNTIRKVFYDNFKLPDLDFTGYIWPIRIQDYLENPLTYDRMANEQINQPEPTYKGFREYWGATYALKEFDKIAPNPGLNWPGNTDTWTVNAYNAGWIVKTDPSEPKVGAILARYDSVTKLSNVSIIREINGDTIVFDQAYKDLTIHKGQIKVDELQRTDSKFLCYIWPKRNEE